MVKRVLSKPNIAAALSDILPYSSSVYSSKIESKIYQQFGSDVACRYKNSFVGMSTNAVCDELNKCGLNYSSSYIQVALSNEAAYNPNIHAVSSNNAGGWRCNLYYQTH